MLPPVDFCSPLSCPSALGSWLIQHVKDCCYSLMQYLLALKCYGCSNLAFQVRCGSHGNGAWVAVGPRSIFLCVLTDRVAPCPRLSSSICQVDFWSVLFQF